MQNIPAESVPPPPPALLPPPAPLRRPKAPASFRHGARVCGAGEAGGHEAKASHASHGGSHAAWEWGKYLFRNNFEVYFESLQNTLIKHLK